MPYRRTTNLLEAIARKEVLQLYVHFTFLGEWFPDKTKHNLTFLLGVVFHTRREHMTKLLTTTTFVYIHYNIRPKQREITS